MRSLGSLTCVEPTSISILVGYSESTETNQSDFRIFLSVFFSYVIISHESATLFVDSAQIDDAVRKHLGPEVKIQPYDSFLPYLKSLADSLEFKEDAVRL